MDSIVPCRTQISDRFPVASFTIRAPGRRFFEVACATDPRLFHRAQATHRTPRNFFTSRDAGLVRAGAGETTWLLPSEQLQRFAGAQRIFYALATYAGPRGEDARFSIHPDALECAPSVMLAPDFTGRALDRGRIGAAAVDGGYGHVSNRPLTWGGDDVLAAQSRSEQPPAPGAYDDGYGGGLWEQAQENEPGADAPSDEPIEDIECADDAPPFEDPPEEKQHGYGRRSALALEQPQSASEDEAEDGASLARLGIAGEELPPDSAPPPKAGATADSSAAGPAPEPLGAEDGPAVETLGLPVEIIYHPAPPAARAGSIPPLPPPPALELPEKLRIAGVVARAARAGRAYGSVDAGAGERGEEGLSLGLFAFTQRSGALGKVLAGFRQRDPNAFECAFGDDGEELLSVTCAASESERLAPVGGRALCEEPWPSRVREACRSKAMCPAQNEVAVTDYLDPSVEAAGWMGFDTPRALAVVHERCLHLGVEPALRWLAGTAGPVRSEADRLRALRALGCTDVAEFRRVVGLGDGDWDGRAAAALCGAVRRLGSRSPLAVPGLSEMLNRVVEAAKNTRSHAALRALRSTPDLSDAAID